MHASPWLRHKPVFRTAHEKFCCQMSGILQQQCWKFQQIFPTNFTLTWPDRSNFCRVAIQYWNSCKQFSTLHFFLIHSCFARGFNIQLLANFYDQTAKTKVQVQTFLLNLQHWFGRKGHQWNLQPSTFTLQCSSMKFTFKHFWFPNITLHSLMHSITFSWIICGFKF